jgi:hypothetical protein
MATKINLIVDQGASFETTLNLTDENDDAVSLVGYTGAGQIRKHYSSSTATNFTVTLGGLAGTVTLGLTANSTANLVAGRYVYDVEVTDSGGTVSRLFEGVVTVTPQVTR